MKSQKMIRLVAMIVAGAVLLSTVIASLGWLFY
ncbi:stressosome-associated protein Prli42 [Paenibacillus radicis (ex Gao et al. 2016)]